MYATSEVRMQSGSYIDGKWFQPKSERVVKNINPADTKDVIAEFFEPAIEAVSEAGGELHHVLEPAPNPSAVP